jgi:hypothetical protein
MQSVKDGPKECTRLVEFSGPIADPPFQRLAEKQEVPGPVADPPLQRLVEQAEIFFCLPDFPDRVPREFDHNEDEDRSAEEHRGGDQFRGHGDSADENDEEKKISGEEKLHEHLHKTPSSQKLVRNMALHLLAGENSGKHDKSSAQNHQARNNIYRGIRIHGVFLRDARREKHCSANERPDVLQLHQSETIHEREKRLQILSVFIILQLIERLLVLHN